MDPTNRRWLEAWERNEIGWHLDVPNPDLRAHYGALWQRVLVPLCGATLDLDFLRSVGKEVVGVELSGVAVARVFDRLGLDPAPRDAGSFVSHGVSGLTLLQGDIFELEPEVAGRFDAVWDRAALVALRPETLERYASTLGRVASGAELLLSVFAGGDPDLGPPFAVPDDVVRGLFDDVELLSEQDVTPRFAERGRAGTFLQRLYRARIR